MKIDKKILVPIEEASEILACFFKGIDGYSGDSLIYLKKFIENRKYDFTLYKSYSIGCDENNMVELSNLMSSILECKYRIGVNCGENNKKTETVDLMVDFFYKIGIDLQKHKI